MRKHDSEIAFMEGLSVAIIADIKHGKIDKKLKVQLEEGLARVRSIIKILKEAI